MPNIVTALFPEARPIIAALQLKKRNNTRGFNIYHGNNISLAVSGIGKQAAASAVAFLQGLQQASDHRQKPISWLNVGIAGSAHLDVGQDILASKIIDHASKAAYYPTFCFQAPCPTGTVITVDSPVIEYPRKISQRSSANATDTTVYDMEATAFFTLAGRFTSSELIHSYKVVSDNPENPPHNITPESASALIDNKMPVIKQLVELLLELETRLPQTDSAQAEIDLITQTKHFSVTQQHQLVRLIQRWHALTGNTLIDLLDITSYKSAKHFIDDLEERIDSLPITF